MVEPFREAQHSSDPLLAGEHGADFSSQQPTLPKIVAPSREYNFGNEFFGVKCTVEPSPERERFVRLSMTLETYAPNRETIATYVLATTELRDFPLDVLDAQYRANFGALQVLLGHLLANSRETWKITEYAAAVDDSPCALYAAAPLLSIYRDPSVVVRMMYCEKIREGYAERLEFIEEPRLGSIQVLAFSGSRPGEWQIRERFIIYSGCPARAGKETIHRALMSAVDEAASALQAIGVGDLAGELEGRGYGIARRPLEDADLMREKIALGNWKMAPQRTTLRHVVETGCYVSLQLTDNGALMRVENNDLFSDVYFRAGQAKQNGPLSDIQWHFIQDLFHLCSSEELTLRRKGTGVIEQLLTERKGPEFTDGRNFDLRVDKRSLEPSRLRAHLRGSSISADHICSKDISDVFYADDALSVTIPDLDTILGLKGLIEGTKVVVFHLNGLVARLPLHLFESLRLEYHIDGTVDMMLSNALGGRVWAPRCGAKQNDQEGFQAMLTKVFEMFRAQPVDGYRELALYVLSLGSAANAATLDDGRGVPGSVKLPALNDPGGEKTLEQIAWIVSRLAEKGKDLEIEGAAFSEHPFFVDCCITSSLKVPKLVLHATPTGVIGLSLYDQAKETDDILEPGQHGTGRSPYYRLNAATSIPFDDPAILKLIDSLKGFFSKRTEEIKFKTAMTAQEDFRIGQIIGEFRKFFPEVQP